MPLGLVHVNPETMHRNPAFSQGIIIPPGMRTLIIGGQNAVNEKGEVVGQGDIAAQTTQAVDNMIKVLEAAGGTLDNLESRRRLLAQKAAQARQELADAERELSRVTARRAELPLRHWAKEWGADPAAAGELLAAQDERLRAARPDGLLDRARQALDDAVHALYDRTPPPSDVADLIERFRDAGLAGEPVADRLRRIDALTAFKMRKEIVRGASDRAGLVQRNGRNGKRRGSVCGRGDGSRCHGENLERAGEGSSRGALSRPRRLKPVPARLFLLRRAATRTAIGPHWSRRVRPSRTSMPGGRFDRATTQSCLDEMRW